MLTLKEQKVLAALEFDAEKSVETIKKESGLSEHTIRYYQHEFLRNGIIKRQPIIDLCRAGYIYIGLFFNPASRSREVQTIIKRSILPRVEIVWLAEFVGEFRYGMAIAGRDMRSIDNTITDLVTKFPFLFRSKSVVHQLSSSFFARKYLPKTNKKSASTIQIAPALEAPDLDLNDKRILAGLVADGAISRRQLAQTLGMPLTTIDYRVERLKKSGILRGFNYAINPKAVERQKYMLLVFGSGMNAKFTQAISNFAEKHPDVVSLYRCLGWWDFELDLETPDHTSALEIADELQSLCKEWVSSIRILSGVRTLKYTLVPFGTR